MSKKISRILKDIHPDILTRVIGHNKLAVRANRTPGRALTNERLGLGLDPIYIAPPLYTWLDPGIDRVSARG